MNTDTININERYVQKYITQNRPSKEIRHKLDIGYTFEKNVIILFAIRPIWTRPNETQELPYAKIRYVKSREIWKLYWMRASGKWELYDPFPISSNLQEILYCINEDSLGCFKG